MIEFLKISNLALLDSVELEFKGGFTAVTGETGAGKSVLLGALSLLAGNRCGKEIIRAGQEACKVEASLNFKDTSKIDAFVRDADIPACEDGCLVLSRTVEKSRAGKCMINGSLSTLSQLAQLGIFWVDFHGPGEPQKLFSPRSQLDMLDAFAGDAQTRGKYLALYADHKAAQARLDELSNARSLSADEADFLRAQLAKIDSVDLDDDAIARLEEDFKLARRCAELVEKSSAISEALGGEDGAGEKLAQALRLSGEISDACAASEALLSRLEGAAIELADIASEYEALASKSASFSEEEIADIEARMDAWLTIGRKYGRTAAAVRAARAEIAFKLESQSDVRKAIADIRAQMEKIEAQIRPVAAQVMASRKAAAEKLSANVEKLLLSLGFKKARFGVALTEEKGIDSKCGSSCEFLFSANAGQAMLGLAKIASSGELARVMLAIKTTLADADGTPLLVFDEVDANVGGEIGVQVGRELRGLSKAHQVFCVTHLPQVAACAANHFLVEKNQDDESTTVSIRELSAKGAERVAELARMLGDKDSASAKAHAKKLLG